MFASLIHFFNKYKRTEKPLLLALSGGPDSLALFLGLKRAAVPFSVAHVNHSWREESSKEARILSELCQKHAVPFFLKVLEKEPISSNLEEKGRLQRYAFFQSLFEEHAFEALLLGHHADDLAETVLKRFCEGGSLTNLHGMRAVSKVGAMPVWRPFLDVQKQQIVAWLQGMGVAWFSDPTNSDSRFLRARLRNDVLPALNKGIGKEVQSSLLRASRSSIELQQFLEAELEPYLKQIARSFLGFFLPKEAIPKQVFLKRCLVERVIEEEFGASNYFVVDQVIELLDLKVGNKRVAFKNRTLFVDRGALFCLAQTETIRAAVHFDRPGKFQWGPFEVTVSEAPIIEAATGWQRLWSKEGICVPIAKGPNSLCAAAANQRLVNGKQLDKWWTEHKVPAALRYILPVVEQNGRVLHEFLSGRTMERSSQEWCLFLNRISDRVSC